MVTHEQANKLAESLATFHKTAKGEPSVVIQ